MSASIAIQNSDLDFDHWRTFSTLPHSLPRLSLAGSLSPRSSIIRS